MEQVDSSLNDIGKSLVDSPLIPIGKALVHPQSSALLSKKTSTLLHNRTIGVINWDPLILMKRFPFLNQVWCIHKTIRRRQRMCHWEPVPSFIRYFCTLTSHGHHAEAKLAPHMGASQFFSCRQRRKPWREIVDPLWFYIFGTTEQAGLFSQLGTYFPYHRHSKLLMSVFNIFHHW